MLGGSPGRLRSRTRSRVAIGYHNTQSGVATPVPTPCTNWDLGINGTRNRQCRKIMRPDLSRPGYGLPRV